MLGDAPPGPGVQRVRISMHPRLGEEHRLRHGPVERLCQVPGGQERVHLALRARAQRVGIAPHIVVPVDHLPCSVQAALQGENSGRAVGLPGILLGARPLQLDGAPGHGASQQRRVQSHIIGAVVAKAARPLHKEAADILLSHPQHVGQRRAHGIGSLGVAPHGELVALHVGYGRRWPQGGVAVVGPEIGGRQGVRGLGGRDNRRDGRRRRRAVDQQIGLLWLAEHVLQKGVLQREVRVVLPGRRHLQGFHGRHGLLLALGYHPQEGGIAHHGQHPG